MTQLNDPCRGVIFTWADVTIPESKNFIAVKMALFMVFWLTIAQKKKAALVSKWSNNDDLALRCTYKNSSGDIIIPYHLLS